MNESISAIPDESVLSSIDSRPFCSIVPLYTLLPYPSLSILFPLFPFVSFPLRKPVNEILGIVLQQGIGFTCHHDPVFPVLPPVTPVVLVLLLDHLAPFPEPVDLVDQLFKTFARLDRVPMLQFPLGHVEPVFNVSFDAVLRMFVTVAVVIALSAKPAKVDGLTGIGE
jgi:hypothetical protein